jgi:nitrite reductase/ring-hydroxylating ferredoxin subunit
MNWTEVARVEEITAGFHVFGTGRKRAVLALINGDLFAFDPVCPHAGGPMQLAETDGLIISCPLHGWRFDLAQGGCELHGYRNLPTFDVRVEHGVIYVAFPDPPPSGAGPV